MDGLAWLGLAGSELCCAHDDGYGYDAVRRGEEAGIRGRESRVALHIPASPCISDDDELHR